MKATIVTPLRRTEPRFLRTLRNMTPDDHVGIACAIAALVLLGMALAGGFR